ncbi:RHS repeat-associated core domain-containing protein, partial [Buttiauxella sp.]|uniref:RHS repeat-associated core domain-containing protein n=1 Tax=Buttiauxella sp. TaxID=1972222 RepID=UPI003C7535FF
ELRRNQLSEDTRQFLSATGLKAENLALWLEPEAENDRKIHLYHCDHLGTPLALVDREGNIDWHITLDPWGNVLSENNPQQLYQPLRMQGQQYDEESGLHYNRHRYYDPAQGRYISQDPIGLAGGWNIYAYPLEPLLFVDPLGLAEICSRPLKGSGGLRTSGSTGIDLGLFHEHIFFDDGTDIGYGADHGLFSEPKTNEYICKKNKYDDERMKKAVEMIENKPDNELFPNKGKQYSDNNYGFILNNCQDFVSDVLNEYENQKDGKK